MATFNITQNGIWPSETYSIFLSSSVLNTAIPFFQAKNYFSFLDNPLFKTNNLVNCSYKGVTYDYSEQNSSYGLLNITNNASINWNLSAQRLTYNLGQMFNYFSVRTNPGTDDQFGKQSSCLIYPSRLFLYPLELIKEVDGWVLTTSAVLINFDYYIFESSNPEADSYKFHENYLKSSPPICIQVPTTPSVNLIYNLSATRQRQNVPLVIYSDSDVSGSNEIQYYSSETYSVTQTPKYKFIFPEKYPSILRLNSCFTTYKLAYYNYLGQSIASQSHPGEEPIGYHGFYSNFYTNLDFLSQSRLLFQMVQSPSAQILPIYFNSIDHCLSVASITLSSGLIEFYGSFLYTPDNSSYVSEVSGAAGSYIGVSYIADSGYFLNGEQHISSLVYFKINNVDQGLNKAILSTNNNINKWKTSYPPHYYSYKIAASSTNTPNKLIDSQDLDFSLKLYSIYESTTALALYPYIGSNYDIMGYSLSADTLDDEYLSFKTIVPNSYKVPEIILSNTIKFFYGPDKDSLVPYDIVGSPFVLAKSAALIYITYPYAVFGDVDFSITSTLSSSRGYLNQKTPTFVNLASGMGNMLQGAPIFIEKITEGQGYIIATSRLLTAENTFPNRDLTNSPISWYVTPYDTPVKAEAVAYQDGTVLGEIKPNASYTFDDFSSTVKFSNLGTKTVTIYLSSQKYNETASLVYDSSKIIYTNLKLAVYNTSELNNSEKTRTINLATGLNLDNQIDPLPEEINITWKWKFDNITDINQARIKLFYGPNKTPYTYGQILPYPTLSSVYVEITPPEESVCRIIPVTFFTETVGTTPIVKGDLTFAVDSFPNRQVFNTDFIVAYENFYPEDSRAITCDTNKDQFYFLRPQGSSNSYKFIPTSKTAPTNIFLSYDALLNSETSATSLLFNGAYEALASWTVSDNTGYYEVLTIDTSASFTTRPEATATVITFHVVSAVAPGWHNNIPSIYSSNIELTPWHNFKTSITIYTLPENYFDAAEFILFPEKQWLNDSKITILDINDYTLSQANTGYKEKASLSQTYWISANKLNSNYDIYIGANKAHLSAFDTNIFKIEFPFTPEYLSTSGLPVFLDVYSDLISPQADLNYFIPISGELVSKQFLLTAQSYPPFLSADSLKTNPTLISYFSYPTLSFALCSQTILLDFAREVYLFQNFDVLPSNSPALVIPNEGSVTYLLSSKYWVDYIDIPAISGVFKAFTLQIGDPYQPGFVGNVNTNELSIVPVSINIPVQITESTFSNYYSSGYVLQSTDSWLKTPIFSLVDYISAQTFVAYSTSVTPKVYISNYITTINNPITIAYEPAGESPVNKITMCKTWFEDSGTAIYGESDKAIEINFNNPGTYYLNYDIHYQDGKRISGLLPNPIVVYEKWPTLNSSDIRTLNEIELILPYSLEQVEIQPNEWGDVDIFNTSLSRLYENLNYLINNSQTVDTKFPTITYGWLGCNNNFKHNGIQWYTKGFREPDYLFPEPYNLISSGLSTSEGVNSFVSIVDLALSKNHIFVLDNNKLRCFKNNIYKPIEVLFDNIEEINQDFIKPSSIQCNEDGTVLYICDPPRNKIIRLLVDYENNSLFFSFNVGGFGGLSETTKFNNSIQIELVDSKIFVLDFNNFAIKEYSEDLNWTNTYFTEEFLLDQPISFDVGKSEHLKNLVYVYTSEFNLYVFDKNYSTPIFKLNLKEIKENLPQSVSGFDQKPFKLILDYDDEFIYIISKNFIFKYSISGSYIGYTIVSYDITNAKKDVNKHLLLSSPLSLIKIQDVTTFFKIGEGLPVDYWSLDQILLKPQEFAEDKTYNRALSRIVHNILTFKNSLNCQFKKIINTAEQLEYFAIYPISVEDRPVLQEDVELKNIKIGANEFHIPQVFNRELNKIYNSLQILANFLKISELNSPAAKVEGIGNYVDCPEPFCWSWKALSNFNLKTPSVRICGVNPITYSELDSKFPVSYAPSKQWKNAISDCCKETPVYTR